MTDPSATATLPPPGIGPPPPPPPRPSSPGPPPGGTRQPARFRVAWIVLGSVLTAGALWWGTWSLVDVLAHGERDVETSFDEPVMAIDIGNDVGDVTVVADVDTSVVTVTERISEGLRSTGVSQQVDGGRLTLRGSCPNLGGTWCSVTYLVEVPAGTAVRVRADDGDVNVSGPAGDVDLSTDDGSVVADGIAAGSVRARSDDGRVFVRLADAPSSVDARSDHGNVQVVVPDTPGAYRVDASTESGSADIAVRTDPDSPRRIVAFSEHGDVTVSYGS